MSIVTATQDYEVWLRTQCDVVEQDLERKHERMRENPFVFLRATYYRWARKVEKWCPDLAEAPHVPSIGDTHTENFGTWRDAEGRLVWGINDFDEAAVMPYPFDLVRLAASVVLAPDRSLSGEEASGAILTGYRSGLANPRPTLLDEQERWMRPYVAVTDHERDAFWKEADRYPPADPPHRVKNALERSLPEGSSNVRFCSRIKGGGGLGRPRYVAIAIWRGGRVCREAKAQIASAWLWAHQRALDDSTPMELARGRHRSPDPFLHAEHAFIYRRIAPDSRKVELGTDAGARLNRDLLTAMGFDLGSIHAAHRHGAAHIQRDLDQRASDWLQRASDSAATAVKQDFTRWPAAASAPARSDG